MGSSFTLVQAADGITNASIADNAYSEEQFDTDAPMKFILGTRVARADGNIPQTATTAIFTIAGGDVLLTQIYGVIGTVIQAQANTMKLQANPTIAGSSVDLCATLDINAKVAGSYLGITGTFATALQNGLSIVGQQTGPIIIPTGTIDVVTSASSTGTIAWICYYVPLTLGATVVAA